MMSIVIAIGAAVLLWSVTEGMVRAMRRGRFTFSLRKKLEFCLVNGVLAAALAVSLLSLDGVAVGWKQIVLLLPLTLLIYYSVLRGFTAQGSSESDGSGASEDADKNA